MSSRSLKYLAGLTRLLLPLMLYGLISLFIQLKITPNPLPSTGSLSPSLGLMMVVAAGSGLVFDLPTFYRHAQSERAGRLSLALIYLLALPLIEGLGLYLSQQGFNQEFWLKPFIESFNIPCLLFLMLAGLQGACLNLYSAATALNTILHLSYKKALLLCTLGTALLMSINLEKNFPLFLELTNLTALIITLFILTYAAFRGFDLPLPTFRQKKLYQRLFMLLLLYALVSKLLQWSLFQDLFLDLAFLSLTLMTTFQLVENKDERT